MTSTQQSIRLPDGSTAELADDDLHVPFVQWIGALRLVISSGQQVLTLTLRRRERLATSADLAGGHTPGITSMLLYMLLAHCAAVGDIPDRHRINQYASLLRRLFAHGAQLSTERLSTSEIRQHAHTMLALGPQHTWPHEVLSFPGDPWSVCRSLFVYGREVWDLRGAAARWWGSLPSFIEPDAALPLIIISVLAEVMMPAPSTLAIAIASSSEAIIDYLSLIGGPEPIPPEIIPDGIGTTEGSPRRAFTAPEHDVEHLRLSADHADALRHLATILLADMQRPLPRYLNQALDIAIPSDLLPRLAAFGVSGFVVVPRRTGLYVAVLNGLGDHLGAAWWSAEAESADRFPLSFPSAAWALVHPVLAAFWYDLCADAIVVEQSLIERPRPPEDNARSFRAKAPARMRRAMLPPVRYRRAAWATDADREIIRQATLVGHGYRRLPARWEERAAQIDFQRRQEAAKERAQRHGYPAPPPGFTFVKAFTRGLVSVPEQAAERRTEIKVRSRGLFTLMLGLQDGAAHAAASFDEEEHW